MKLIRMQIILCAALAATGILLVVSAFIFADDHQRSYFIGAGLGLVVPCTVMLVYSIYLYRNPEKAKKHILEKNEERAVFIMEKSVNQTVLVLLVLIFVAALVAMILGQRIVTYTLAGVVVVIGVTLLILWSINNKKY